MACRRRPPHAVLSVLLALGAACLALPASAQQKLVRVDDAQLERAGVKFASVTTGASRSARITLSGSVVFSSTAVELVSAPAAGVVQSLLVQPMQQVKAGAPMLKLHSPQVLEWQREYVQGNSQLALMTDKLARDEALFKEGIIARGRLEESRSAHLQAQALVQEHRQLLRLAGMSDAALSRLNSPAGLSPELTVTSRHAGTVIEQSVNVGQRVEAGTALLKVAKAGELVIELQAGREQAQAIAVGDAVSVAGCNKPGRITAKGLQVNPGNQLQTLRAAVPEAGNCLRANQHVQAEVVLASSTSGFSVPASALVRHEGRDYLLLRAAGGVQPISVTVDGRDGERLLVKGALPEKASVAVSGTALLKGVWLGLGHEPGPVK